MNDKKNTKKRMIKKLYKEEKNYECPSSRSIYIHFEINDKITKLRKYSDFLKYKNKCNSWAKTQIRSQIGI